MAVVRLPAGPQDATDVRRVLNAWAGPGLTTNHPCVIGCLPSPQAPGPPKTYDPRPISFRVGVVLV